MNKIFEIRKGGIELNLAGDNEDDQFFEQYHFIAMDIEISIGAFKAKKNTTIEASDIEYFIKDLERVYKNLKGSAARLTNIDGDFSFLFESNELGHINISGNITDGDIRQNELNFNFTIDQSYIPHILKEISLFMNK